MPKKLDLTDNLEKYIIDHSETLSDVQNEIIQHNKSLGDQQRLQISISQAQFLQTLVKVSNVKKILEIGAGKSLAQNIYLSYMFQGKVEQTLIDISKMIDLDLFNKANEQIAKILDTNRLPFAKTIDDLKKNYNMIYLAPMRLDQISKKKITNFQKQRLHNIFASFAVQNNIWKKKSILHLLFFS